MLVLGEVGGNPVQDDADARLMEAVDQGLEAVRRAKAGVGGKKARDLVAPGKVQGMLHHRHELHMGEAQLLHIGHHLVRHALVGI